MKRVSLACVALAVSVLALGQTLSARPPAAIDPQQPAPAFTPPKNDKIPVGDVNTMVADALKASTRHGEWIDIKLKDGKPLRAWLEYPERRDKAGVVIVIHEIFGLTDWVRAVADQVAKDGFIAIAPDLLSGMAPNGGGSEELGQQGSTQVIRTLTNEERAARLDAVMAYGKTIPAGNGKTGVVGFCWGGGSSLSYAISQPALSAAVMYYGPAPTVPGSQTPDLSGLPKITAPILAFYGGNDARVTGSAQPIADEMKKLGKSFDFHIYDGAAHGFLRAQGQEANYKASEQAWPLTIAFFQKYLK